MVTDIRVCGASGIGTRMRDHIINEIRRLAAQNGGQAPGNRAFVSATGIVEAKWRGKYWARWGDALIEAGFQPNQWTGKTDSDAIISGVISACRHYGRFPTNSEIDMLRLSDRSIPAPNVIKSNFGRRPDLIAALKAFIGKDTEYADVLAMLPAIAVTRASSSKGTKPVDGHVYLLKSGDFYKIGRSDELERRVKEIRTALPDVATLIHPITTDDPPGIEAYWHRRFADRRANGEWFKLTPEDVKAFMRRKFQ
jgi:Meiotically up-regulated gene 113